MNEQFQKILEKIEYVNSIQSLSNYKVARSHVNNRENDWVEVLSNNIEETAQLIYENELRPLIENYETDDIHELTCISNIKHRFSEENTKYNDYNDELNSAYGQWYSLKIGQTDVDTCLESLQALVNAMIDKGITHDELLIKNCGFSLEEVDACYEDLEKFLKKTPLTNTTHKIIKSVPFGERGTMSIEQISEDIGFNLDKGSVNGHVGSPMTINVGKGDVWCFYRNTETNHLKMLGSLYHELGHGLYEQYLNENPLLQMAGISVHEAIAFIYERHYFPTIIEKHEKSYGKSRVSFRETLMSRRALPSRVHCDEISYLFHLVLRHRVEKMLFAGSSVKKCAKYFVKQLSSHGIDAVTIENSFCYDPHWFMGNFGYFPSYAMGQIMAAQFVNKFGVESLSTDLQQVFAYGNTISQTEIVERVTGETLSSQYLIEHLRKYL